MGLNMIQLAHALASLWFRIKLVLVPPLFRSLFDGQPDGGQLRRSGKQSVFDSIQWTSSRVGHWALGGSWSSRYDNCSVFAKEVSNDEWWSSDPFIPLSPWWLCGDPWLSIGFRIVRPLNEGTAEQWARYWQPDSEELKRDVDSTIQAGRGINGRPLISPRLRKESLGNDH